MRLSPLHPIFSLKSVSYYEVVNRMPVLINGALLLLRSQISQQANDNHYSLNSIDSR
jgi:hypothetical protein